MKPLSEIFPSAINIRSMIAKINEKNVENQTPATVFFTYSDLFIAGLAYCNIIES